MDLSCFENSVDPDQLASGKNTGNISSSVLIKGLFYKGIIGKRPYFMISILKFLC